MSNAFKKQRANAGGRQPGPAELLAHRLAGAATVAPDRQHQLIGTDNQGGRGHGAGKLKARLHNEQRSSLLSNCKSPCERLLGVVLPLIFAFILPTIKFDQQNEQTTAFHQNWPHDVTSDFLLALVRLPIDRLRLESSLMLGAQAKEVTSKQDLQEEETHMMVAPAGEQRANYVAAPHQAPGSGHGYAPDTPAGSHAAAELHTHPLPVEYAPAPVEAEQAAGPAGDGGPAPTGGGGTGGGSALQARNDLPAVRALNVKCEKNHMTVSNGSMHHRQAFRFRLARGAPSEPAQ